MGVATFDTLKFANTLKAAGVPPQQAEAEAAAFAEVIQINLKELVTKEDLERGVVQLRSETTQLGRDLRHEIKEESLKLSYQITQLRGEFNQLKWMTGGVITLCVGILVRLFFKP